MEENGDKTQLCSKAEEAGIIEDVPPPCYDAEYAIKPKVEPAPKRRCCTRTKCFVASGIVVSLISLTVIICVTVYFTVPGAFDGVKDVFKCGTNDNDGWDGWWKDGLIQEDNDRVFDRHHKWHEGRDEDNDNDEDADDDDDDGDHDGDGDRDGDHDGGQDGDEDGDGDRDGDGDGDGDGADVDGDNDGDIDGDRDGDGDLDTDTDTDVGGDTDIPEDMP